MQDQKPYSLGAIIVLLIFFWPVAVYMIISNLMASSAQMSQNAATAEYVAPQTRARAVKPKNFTALKIIGGILLAFGILFVTVAVWMAIDDPAEELRTSVTVSIVFLIVLIAPGAGLIWIAKAQGNKSRLKCRYVEIINHSDDLSIAGLGKQTGQTEQQAFKLIEEMLAQRYFPNCYIDRENMMFCFPKIEDAYKYGYQTAVLNCPSCGAKNVLIAGTVRKCGHCGSPVKAEPPPPPPAPPPGSERKTFGQSVNNAANSAAGAFERFMNKLFK